MHIPIISQTPLMPGTRFLGLFIKINKTFFLQPSRLVPFFFIDFYNINEFITRSLAFSRCLLYITFSLGIKSKLFVFFSEDYQKYVI